MPFKTANLKVKTASTSLSFAATPAPTAQRLRNADIAAVLDFLDARPLCTFIMSGFIRDNGLESELNRGTFYGYRNAASELEGVALIGHANYFEATSDAALREFARVARGLPDAKLILAEHETTERFWAYFSEGRPLARRTFREVLVELRRLASAPASIRELRPATVDHLDLIVPVHAALAFEESGVDPLRVDADGFRMRCRRRVEQRRVWVLIDGGTLIFKIDVVSDTPAVSYIEGLYVAAEHRGKGLGYRCLSQVCAKLLQPANSITALVNEQKHDAVRFLEVVGFERRCLYQTLFLETSPPVDLTI